jgi:LuxR family maltose regulon positive regulatory protein
MNQFSPLNKSPKLTLLVAPAGYGKSTLLAQRITKLSNESVAWLSLDDDDNHLDTFLDYLCAACQMKFSDDHLDKTSDQFSAAPGANYKLRLKALFSAIEEMAKPLQLVLDDFHVISKDKTLQCIDWLINFMPANMSLLLASRQQPILPCLTVLKSQGELLEIPAHQLNFTLKETGSFLSSDKQVSLAPDSVLSLFKRTEGWVGATQLALHALHQQTNQDDFIRHFSGNDRDIVKYLGECVLNQQDAETQTFFLYSAVLKRLNSELCKEVTGLSNSFEILERINQEGLFLFELDRDRHWFRYHHLAKDFLLSRLEQLYPEKSLQLYLKAAHWFRRQGDVNQAIDYYLCAQEYDIAAHLMAEHVSTLVQYQGNHEILLQWITQLPEKNLHQEPRIVIGLAWSLIFTRDLKPVEGVLDILRAELKRKQTQQHTLKDQQDIWLTYNLEMLETIHEVMAGNSLAARARSANWAQAWPDAPEFERGAVLAVQGASCLQTLELKLARSILVEAKKLALSCETDYGVAWIDFGYALIHVRQGHLMEARHILEGALKVAIAQMGEHSLACTLLKLGLAQVCYDRNEIEQAQNYIDAGFLSIDDHGLVDTLHIAFLTKSKLLNRQGLASEAMAVLLDAEEFGRRLDLANFESSIVAERIRLMLLSNKVDEAVQLYSERGLESPAQNSRESSPREQLVLDLIEIRMDLAFENTEQALQKLSASIRTCKKYDFVQDLVVFSLLEAKCYFELDKKNQAFRSIQNVMALTSHEGVLSPFIDEQHHLLDILPEYFSRLDKQTHHEKLDAHQQTFIKQLKALFNVSQEKELKTSGTKPSKTEKLSKRELELLSYLDQGLSNQALADVLFLSVATIKWHLSHIYTKLGVKNRLEAIKAYQKIK